MYLSYHRVKMKLIRRSVEHIFHFCNGCNQMISYLVSPFARIGKRISAEAPWFVFIFASTIGMMVPLLVYPYLKPSLGRNVRYEQEEERVRLCLQKGIDPYPYMRHKDLVYGNNATIFSSETQTPKEAAWEHNSVNEFQRRKEVLCKQVDGDMDYTVQRLLDLKKKQIQESAFRRKQINQEPKNLIFSGRPDTDKLLS